jgi:hypothetical protein
MDLRQLVWTALTRSREEEVTVAETLALFWGRHCQTVQWNTEDAVGYPQIHRLLRRLDVWTRLEVLERCHDWVQQRTCHPVCLDFLTVLIRRIVATTAKSPRRQLGCSP